MKVLICGGGTGGHIYPALAVAKTLQQKGFVSDNFLWIGTSGQVEEKLVPAAGIRLETIKGGAIAGVSWPAKLRNAANLIWSIQRAYQLIKQFNPNVIFLTGGYVNGPVAIAARNRRVPMTIYLPDIQPGMAIRYLSRLAVRITCTAKESLKYFATGKAVETGYPVRPELRSATLNNKLESLREFGLSDERKTLFVFGGSRGARSINRALMRFLPDLLEVIQVIHISGELDWPEVKDNEKRLTDRQRPFYRAYEYLHDRMGAAYQAADLVVARAGASMLGESPAFGVPAILVPYPYAWRYQKTNADYLVSRGAAIRLDDDRLDNDLAPTILNLFSSEEKLVDMARAARKLDRPDAAEKISNVLIEISKRAIP